MAGGCAQSSSEPSEYVQPPSPSPELTPPPGGAKADVINYIYTTERAFAITFTGMSDIKTMETLLDELDQYNMKAIFFLPGMRVAEEPDIANEILKRGHSIGNDSLSGIDLTRLTSYEEIYNEINKANRVIKEKTGTDPRFLATLGGKYDDRVLMAAEACGLDLVTYTINFQTWEGRTAREVEDYLLNKITRGGVIALSADDLDYSLDTIRLIAKVKKIMGYSVQPLEYLIENSYERRPLEEIPGWDAVAIDKVKDGPVNIIYNGSGNKKVVTLSFDDWGCDYSITRIMDLLKQYNIKASFFLRGNGVIANPNLAKAIAEEGHDVANHTFWHKAITDLTPEEMQEEIVHCHQVLTEAIQEQPALMFRPPAGELNEETARAAAATGYQYIALYDVTTNDWDTANDAQDILNTVQTKTKAGSVIVMHLMIGLDTYEALPQMIEYLLDQGYQIIPLSQMIEEGDAEITSEIRPRS